MEYELDPIGLKITKDIEHTFVGIDKNEDGSFPIYGPFKKNDIAVMEKTIGDNLISSGYAEKISFGNNGSDLGGVIEGSDILPDSIPLKTNEYSNLNIPQPVAFNIINLIDDTNEKVYTIQFPNRPHNRCSLLITKKHYQPKEIRTWIRYSPSDIERVISALYNENLEHIIAHDKYLRENLLLNKLTPPKKIPRWEFFLDYLKTRQDNNNLERLSYIEYNPITNKKIEEIIENINTQQLVRDCVSYSPNIDKQLYYLYSAYLLEPPKSILIDYNNFNPTMLSFTPPGVGKTSYITGVETVRKDAHVSEKASSPGLMGTVTRSGKVLRGALDNFHGCLMVEEIDTNNPDIFKHMNNLLEQGVTTITLCGRSFKVRSSLDVIITGNIKKHESVDDIIIDFMDTIIKLNPNTGGFGRRIGVLAIGDFDLVQRSKKPDWWKNEIPRYILRHINKYIKPGISFVYDNLVDFLNKKQNLDYEDFVKDEISNTGNPEVNAFFEGHIDAFYRRNNHALRLAMIQNLDLMYELTLYLKDNKNNIDEKTNILKKIKQKAKDYSTTLIKSVCKNSVRFVCKNLENARDHDIKDWRDSLKENSLDRWLIDYFDKQRSNKLGFKIQVSDIIHDLKEAIVVKGINVDPNNLYARVIERIETSKFKLCYGLDYNKITKTVKWGLDY